MSATPAPITEATCAAAMTRLKDLKSVTASLQARLTGLRREQKLLLEGIGAFLVQTNRESVRMGDLIVQAQTTTVPGKVNILTNRAHTAQSMLTELERSGITVTADQWGALIQRMRVSNAKTKRNVKLLHAS